MNTNFKIDLSQIPSTLDLIHVSLAGTVLVLALLLIFILISMVISLSRRIKNPPVQEARPIIQEPQPLPEPEIKIVEKIVEVEVEKTVEKIVPGPAPEPIILKESTPDAALQLLNLLQNEARFIDFIKEDISQYSDTEVGAAARVVHKGCNQTINDHFKMTPIRSEQENSTITVPDGFDASKLRLTGNIVGHAPFTGTLVHKGWQVTDIHLPQLTEGHNAQVIATAEVEL